MSQAVVNHIANVVRVFLSRDMGWTCDEPEKRLGSQPNTRFEIDINGAIYRVDVTQIGVDPHKET